MRLVSDLITQVRSIARNIANPDGTYSLTDLEVVQYLNDAQDSMQSKMSATKNISKIFVTESIISIVAGQAAYTIPDRVLLNKQIENVEFSATGSATDYCRLEKVSFMNRDTYPTTYPSGYFKRGNQIVLQPTPASATGSIRVLYEREVDDLAPITDTVSGTPVLAAIVGATGSSAFVAGKYINIIGPDGSTRLKNGLILNYVGGTKTITLAANVSTYLQGSYALADLDTCFITVGFCTTTLSQLPDACERYLIHAAAADVFGKDNAADHARQYNKAEQIKDEIIRAFSAQTAEVEYVPQINRYEFW